MLESSCKVCLHSTVCRSPQDVVETPYVGLNGPTATWSVISLGFFSHVFQGESEVDVIAEQLKFRACLKILMTELRTLATGFEVDGGKLRFQLYSWLEKEIAAMHKICNYKVSFAYI